MLSDYPIEKLIPAIDWNQFFQVWQLRGKYPNRTYPKLFNDPDVGAEAKKVFDEGQDMLKTILEEKWLVANAVIAFYKATSTGPGGEDIQLYNADGSKKAVLYGLRQQEKKAVPRPFCAIGDFIAPPDSGVEDYMGMFACSVGFGMDEKVKQFEADHDDYSSIMLKALTDRLAEAFAEVLHAEVRKTYWGYAPDEDFSANEMHKIKYRVPHCFRFDCSSALTLLFIFSLQLLFSVPQLSREFDLPLAIQCNLTIKRR